MASTHQNAAITDKVIAKLLEKAVYTYSSKHSDKNTFIKPFNQVVDSKYRKY